MDSLKVNQVRQKLDQFYKGKLKETDLYSLPTISEMAKYIDSQIKVVFSTIKQMQTYMVSEVSYRFEKETHGFSIQGDALEKLEHLMDKLKVNVDTILMSGLSYLLTRISGDDEVILQTIMNSEGLIKPIMVDFHEIHETDQLFQRVYEQNVQNSVMLPVQALNDMTIEEKQNAIVPLYCRKEYFNQYGSVLGLQDFIIEVDEKLGEIQVYCHFNNQKLRSEKVKEFMFNYKRLIDSMIEQPQYNEGAVLQ